MPKVSIGITTYKRLNKLIRCVRSILSQSYENFEILIGNDDVDQKILPEMDDVFKVNKVKIINNDKNLGERENMNNLLKSSLGEYFIWLSDDDFLFPTFLERNIEAHKQNDTIIVSYTSYTSINQKNSKKKEFKIFNQIEFLENFLSKKIKLIGVYGLFKKKYLDEIGGMQITSKSLENSNNEKMGIYPYADIILPIKISKFGKIAYSYDELIYYDIDDGSRSSTTKDFHAHIESEKDVRMVIDEIIKENKNLIRIKNNLDYYLAKWFFINQMSILNRDKNKKNFIKIILIIKIILRYTFSLSYKNKIRFVLSFFFK